MNRPRVLIIEDNPTHQKLAAMMFGKHGVSCKIVERPDEAVRELNSKNSYCAVFLDLGVPQTQAGVRCLMQLNLMKHSRRLQIPIITMTAHAMDEDREACFALGADDYLSKPYTVDQLAALLNRWIFSPKRRLAS